MSRFQLTHAAQKDIAEIWRYIARDSFDAADRVTDAIYGSCALLAQSPLVGQRRPDVTRSDFRFWTVPSFRKYTIVYDPESRPIRIMRIFHGARNIRRQLGRK